MKFTVDEEAKTIEIHTDVVVEDLAKFIDNHPDYKGYRLISKYFETFPKEWKPIDLGVPKPPYYPGLLDDRIMFQEYTHDTNKDVYTIKHTSYVSNPDVNGNYPNTIKNQALFIR